MQFEKRRMADTVCDGGGIMTAFLQERLTLDVHWTSSELIYVRDIC